MRKPKSYSILEVLNWSDVGLNFEFYSTKESKFIVDELGSLIGKSIILTNESTYRPSYSSAILLKEYEAKRSRYQFRIAQQNYHSVVPIIDVVSGWISEHCETTFDTRLNISLSFNHRHLDTLQSISQMNPSRLILKFDENEVYKRFPTQKGSPYSLSVKSLTPVNSYINEAEMESHIRELLSTPFAEFYGINFENYTNGILEFNYVGGEDYAFKTKEIKDVLEYFIIKTYQSINEEELNHFEKYELNRLSENFDKIQMSFWDPDTFMNEFQDLKIYVDLQTSRQIVKTFWSQIRGPLFEMIINGGLRKGIFNYDTEVGRYQLKEGKVGGTMIKNMDFVACELTGVLENCVFASCNISRARIYNSKFERSNKLLECYLRNASVNKGNEIKKCYVVNDEEIINCDVAESVIKYATPGKHFKIDESSTLIVKSESLPEKTDHVVVDEIRDYSWIKGMRKSNDEGFANEYNKRTYKNN